MKLNTKMKPATAGQILIKMDWFLDTVATVYEDNGTTWVADGCDWKSKSCTDLKYMKKRAYDVKTANNMLYLKHTPVDGFEYFVNVANREWMPVSADVFLHFLTSDCIDMETGKICTP